MIYIDRKTFDVPEVFSSDAIDFAVQNIEKFYTGRKKTRSQKRYSKQFEPELRTPILESLWLLFKGKCAYCESSINLKNSGIYDHFRPKFGARGLEKEFADEHYWWLTYEWQNFYLSCAECNRYKATWFPVEDNIRSKPRTRYDKIIQEERPLLIDPCNDKPEKHLTFKDDGTVDFLTQKGKVTIDLLHLNRIPLIEARRKALYELFNSWEFFLSNMRGSTNSWKRVKEIAKDWVLILKEQSPQPFIACCKQLLVERMKNYPETQDFLTRKLYDLNLETRSINQELRESNVIIIDDAALTQKEQITRNDQEQIIKSLPSILTKQLYLESIELHNYKCFDDLKLNFKGKQETTITNEVGQPWHLFLGENGVGKSSILKAIAIALMGSGYRERIQAEYLDPKTLLKKGKKTGHITLTYNDGIQTLITFTENEISATANEPVTNLIAYGAVRLLPKNTIQPEKENFKGVKVGNLLDYSIALGDANNWLLQLNQKEFDKAAIALKDLMLLEEDAILMKDKKNKQILVKTGSGQSLSIDDLSDGYRSIYALTVDIMSTLSSENVTYDLAEGIILIDEIGTHLHPRWKMQIVDRLRNAFPGLQFIVSTHEPLCLRGLKAGETIVLMQNESKQVIAVTDLPDPSELRVDQILTSEFFGLKSTLDLKTERLFDEYYAILAKDEQERTDLEKLRIFELNAVIPKIKHLGDDLREDLVYYVIDQLLAKKVKTDGLHIREVLKEEALKRVESIWNSIKNEPV